MAKLGIVTGTIPDDGTGDTLLGGAIKINSNFNEVYTFLGDGSNLNVGVWRKTSVGINTTLNVGIGTTNPISTLTVSGNARVSGATTVGSISIGNTEVISDAFQLKNIASLDATTTATIESAIALAPNTFNDIRVTGLSSFVGLSTFGNGIQVISGVSTLGVTTATNLTSQNILISGISTLGDTIVGGATTQLVVNGDARITGILTIGTSSITLDGSNNQITVGSGSTLSSSGLIVSGISTLGFVTTSNIYSSGIITSSSFVGNLTGNSDTSTYASSAGVATYSSSSGISTYASSAGVATYSSSSGISTYADTAGIATSVNGGTVSVTQLSVSGFSTFSGIATVTGETLFTNQLSVSGISTCLSDINVGINTDRGLVLTSPNGTKYRLIVDNAGVLSTVLVP